ncbi:MAG: hypothetical protein KDI78_08600 [Xanthomonadales bacterium]|nr:hypothetical protein [Xanthomonadales bacterium]
MFYLLALAMAISPAKADSEPFCPPSIEVKQELVDTPPGWQTINFPNQRSFQDADVFLGYPDHFGKPKPSSEIRGDNWSVPGTESWDVSGVDLWVVCYYSSTTISLTKRLPEEHRCTNHFSNPREGIKADFVCEPLKPSSQLTSRKARRASRAQLPRIDDFLP